MFAHVPTELSNNTIPLKRPKIKLWLTLQRRIVQDRIRGQN